MDSETIFVGIGAIVAAAGGVILVVREFRRRDHIESNREISQLSYDLHQCRHAQIEWRRYAFDLRERLADRGHDVPDPPNELM